MTDIKGNKYSVVHLIKYLEAVSNASFKNLKAYNLAYKLNYLVSTYLMADIAILVFYLSFK